MELPDLIREARKLSRPYRVKRGSHFRLKDFDPADTGPFDSSDKDHTREILDHGVQALSTMQDKLYAQDRWAVLLVFQAMDAAGKDGVIKHVMSGINPQGCQVQAFKAPSPEELDHDYLWRCVRHLPERGRVGLFNRSYYEEVLVVRVHPEILDHQKLPASRVTRHIWDERHEDIRGFERYLDRNGVLVRKFFLHVSKKEQKKRFLERIENPAKNWKFDAGDIAERHHWKDYQAAYQDMIRATATERAPWYVVPADNKWYTRLVVASAIIDALDSLDLDYPEPAPRQLAQLAAARKELLAE